MPHTIPTGWYFVASDRAIRPGVTSLTVAGRELVLWRDHAGALHLQPAWCPHLGADLRSGRVTRHGLRCPFHGLAFDGAGRCTAPDGSPTRVTLPPWPLARRGDLWFAWVGPGAPAFELPPLELGDTPAVRTLRFPGHPERVTENSVDHAHFGPIHGYDAFRVLEAPDLTGAELRARYAFSRPVVAGLRSQAEIDIRVVGLGVSQVDVCDERFGARLRLLVLPTPETADTVRLTLALAIQELAGRRVPPWLARMLSPVAMAQYARDVLQDVAVWSQLRPPCRPALTRHDGPIGRYRRWARQFYPEVPT